MAKKQKIKNEDPSINFRLTPELKKWITNQSVRENKTVSNYLRDHLIAFMDGSLFESEEDLYGDKSFFNSTRFLQLVSFVFAKRNNNKCNSTIKQLNYHIRTIKEMEMKEIPRNLIDEFDKVLEDLIRVKKIGSTYFAPTFKFCETSYTDPNFNYDLLENYLLNVLKPFEEGTIIV